MLKDKAIGTSFNPLNEYEKKYIKERLGLVKLQEIRKFLRRDIVKVVEYAKEVRKENPSIKVMSNQKRFTEDFHHVGETDAVWEILYYWRNAEYSEAYPYHTTVRRVPKEFPIWISYDRCKEECDRINQNKLTM